MKRISFVIPTVVALLSMVFVTLTQSMAQTNTNFQVYLPLLRNGNAPPPVLDGIEVIIDSPFMPGDLAASEPGNANQLINAFDLKPFRQFTVTSVAYGQTAPVEGLPKAEPGGSLLYRSLLAQFRQSQGGTPTQGPIAVLFGQSVTSSYSIVDLMTDYENPTPTLVVEWVTEANERIWIVIVVRDISDGTNQNTFLNSLVGLTVNAGDIVDQQQALQSSVPETPFSVDSITTLTPPPWWMNETCNVVNHPGSYRMASYEGLDACGPTGTEREVNFGVGDIQLEWQCAELAKRYLYLKYEISPYQAHGNQVVTRLDAIHIGTTFERITNGTPNSAPQPGDVISFETPRPQGHVAVVISSNVNNSGNGSIGIIEQNASAVGTNTVRVNNWRVGHGTSMMAINWLHEIDTAPGCETITRVSVASDRTQGTGSSVRPSISANGLHVAFSSSAPNLVSGDTNGVDDVFVHNRDTGETFRISVASDGTQGNIASWFPSISSDGRFVAFQSWASSLVSGDTNEALDIFVHDRDTARTTRISVASDGTQGNGSSYHPSISANGRYVTFTSVASNLVSGDTNGWVDVFVHDRDIGETTRVSVATDKTQGNSGSFDSSISADGRLVAFQSWASNLVSGDTNETWDLFVHDRVTGKTTMASVASDKTHGNSASWAPSISADGRYVVFVSAATNLVSGDTNGVDDVFVHDRDTGETTRVSVACDEAQGNSVSWAPSISADGQFVAFESEASNLVSGDTNKTWDVFVHDRGPQ
jgi:Tol biopolymer transport system component